MGQSAIKNLGNGGEMDGDVTITGDLEVQGGISLSVDEVIQGTSTIDVTNTEALLVRKNDDGGDVFIVDTTNSRVGIGITTPSAPMEIYSTNDEHLRINNPDGGWNYINFNHGSTTEGFIGTNGNEEVILGSTPNNPIVFIVQNAERARITNTGVGIGTDSPSENLEVYGGDSSAGVVRITGGEANNAVLQLYADQGDNTSDKWQLISQASDNDFLMKSNTTEVLRLTDGTGNLQILGGGTFGGDVTVSKSGDTIISAVSSSNTSGHDAIFVANVAGTSAGDPFIRFNIDNIGAWSVGVDNSDSDKFKISGLSSVLGTNDRFVLDTSGNVGIGASPITTHSAVTQLTLGGNSLISSHTATGASGALRIGQNSYLNSSGNTAYVSEDQASMYTQKDGTHKFQVVGSGTGVINTSFIDALLIDNSGNSTFAGDIVYSGTSNLLKTSTSDGSDNASITIDSSGGGLSRTRGAYIAVYGNEHSNGGIVDIQTGNDSGAKITLRTGDGGTRMIIDENSRISLSNNDSGTSNTVFGKLAGDDLDSGGNYNSLFGENAGHAVTTGDYNVAIGINSLDGSTNAQRVTAIGTATMRGNATADAIGTVAVGYGALNALTSGAGNVAVGYESLNVNTNGNQSTAIGHQALKAQTGTSGEVANTAVGYQAGLAITTGIQNTALGSGALKATDDGGSNTAIGAFTMGLGNAGGSNTAVGGQCLVDVTGSNNVAVGFQTLFDLTSGGENIGIGHSAGKLMNGAEAGNTIIGIGSMADANNDSTSKNVAVGNYTLNDIGTNAQVGLVAIGYEALRYLTSGVGNTAVGFESLKTENDGSRNTAIGYKALTTLNTSAGNGETTAIGFEAGMDVSTGIANTFVGSRAGNQGTNDITTGSNNTMIGKEARGSANSASNQTVIGASATGVADNSVTLGNGDVTAVYMAQDKSATMLSGEIEVVQASGVNAPVAFIRTENSSDYSSSILTIQGDRTTTNNTYNLANFTNAGTPKCVITDGGNLLNTNNSYGAISDEKLKQDIEDANSQWDDIKAVRFRKFKFKDMVEDGFKLGVVAQELEKVSPSLISEAIDRDVDGKDLGTTTKSVKYSILQMKGIVALQEALNRIETLEAKVKELESK